MPIPNINENDVLKLLPDIKNVHQLPPGGQKRVFACDIFGQPCVLKFLLLDSSSSSQVISRAEREIDTLEKINTPKLVKLGPINLTSANVNGQNVVFYSEERIDGKDIKTLLNEKGVLTIDEVRRLCIDISEAIDKLWSIRRIHRDIKPGNIMLRNDTGNFVLLDMGIVFDLGDISLTPTPLIMGTIGYHSPEQLSYRGRRALDFRSDLFSLGVVLYESLIGENPFTAGCSSQNEVIQKTINFTPQRPSLILSDVPDNLDTVITRLLNKDPHLRFNSCTDIINRV